MSCADSFSTRRVRRSRATRSDVTTCTMFWRYVNRKIPPATATNSVTSGPTMRSPATNASMALDRILGTSRFNALAATVKPTIANTRRLYGTSSAVNLGPAGSVVSLGSGEGGTSLGNHVRIRWRDVGLRRDDVLERVPALPCPADDRKIHPAVVRRRPGGVDYMHAVLSGAAAGRVCLRAWHCHQLAVASPGPAARRVVDRVQRGGPVVVHRTVTSMEAGER